MPVTNFEKYTKPLNKKELSILNDVIDAFKKYTKEKPIKAKEICPKFNEWLSKKGVKLKMNPARIGRYGNHIRTHGLIPLIATSNGYYVSYDKDEMTKEILSLQERARAINRAADGLQVLYNQLHE